MSEPSGRSSIFGRIADDYLERLQCGEHPSIEDYANQHPEMAEMIREILPLLDLPTRQQHHPNRPIVPGYEILDELGRGGMGVVYRARQRTLKRIVALKVIRQAELADPRERERFLAEAEIAAKLHHPGIVQIYEYGESSSGPYFSLELIAGGSLAQSWNGEPQSPREVAAVIRSLADALDVAHRAGIIHRDLKPANVLIDDRPKITDFGLARQTDSNLTASGVIVGTPTYMAPEQASGKTIDARCDVWALGVILYEGLTGRPPFRGTNTIETLDQVQRREPTPPSSLINRIPRDLETICLKCLEKEPHRRYSSVAELGNDLDHFLSGRSVSVRPVGAVRRGWRWCQRNPVIAGLLFGIMLLALTVAIGGIWTSITLNDQLVKVTQAEADANQRLADSLFDQVVSKRLSGGLGQRFANIDKLKESIALRRKIGLSETDRRKYADEWIRCSILPDLKLIDEWQLTDVIDDVAFTRDGERVAILSPDGIITVRPLDNTSTITIQPMIRPIDRMVFSPGGTYLLVQKTISESKTDAVPWELFDTRTGQPVEHPTLPCHSTIDFSSDDQSLAMISAGRLLIWNIPSGEVKRLDWLLPNDGCLVAWRPHSSWIAVGVISSKRFMVIDIKTNRIIDQDTSNFSIGSSLTWSPLGDLLVCLESSVGYSSIRTFRVTDDRNTLKTQNSFPGTKNRFEEAVTLTDYDVIARSTTGEIKLYGDSIAGQLEDNGFRRIAYTRKGLITCSSDGRVQHWQAAPSTFLDRTPSMPNISNSPWTVHPATVGVRLQPFGESRNLATMTLGPSTRTARSHFVGITAGNGDYLYTGGKAGSMLWPVSLKSGTLHVGPPRSLPFAFQQVSSDGRWLYASEIEQTKIASVHNPGTIIDTLVPIEQRTISPGAKWLAGRGIRVYRIGETTPVLETAVDEPFAHPYFSSDGRWFVCSTSKYVHVWRTGEWTQPLYQFQRAIPLKIDSPQISQPITGIAITYGGDVLAYWNDSESIHLVSLETGSTIASLPGKSASGGQQLLFFDDERLLVQESLTTNRMWDLRAVWDDLRNHGIEWPHWSPPSIPLPPPITDAVIDTGDFTVTRPQVNTNTIPAKLNEQLTSNPEMYWRLFRERAELNFNNRLYAKSIDDATDYLRRDSNNAAVLLLRGMAYWELGRFAEAKADLRKSIQFNPNPKAIAILIVIDTNAPEEFHDYAEALQLANASIGFGNDAFLRIARGMAYYRAGHYSKAAELLKGLPAGSWQPGYYYGSMTFWRMGNSQESANLWNLSINNQVRLLKTTSEYREGTAAHQEALRVRKDPPPERIGPPSIR